MATIFAATQEECHDFSQRATPFQGVDRSVDTDRLAGIRIDGTSLTMSEAFIDAGQRLREAGKRPDHIFCNPVRFGQLVKETSSGRAGESSRTFH